MSSNRMPGFDQSAMSIADLEYPQIIPLLAASLAPVERSQEKEPEIRLTEASLLGRLATERAEGTAEATTRLRRDFEVELDRERTRISNAILNFEQTRKEYFTRVEAEVVQLALSIAAKILHREAQVDPMLVAAIVQIALGQLKDGSAATIRLRPAEAAPWRQHFAALDLNVAVTVVEDANLAAGDCLFETELGNVNFSLDAQLKEVEQGFLDVLAQKPQV